MITESDKPDTGLPEDRNTEQETVCDKREPDQRGL